MIYTTSERRHGRSAPFGHFGGLLPVSNLLTKYCIIIG